MACSKCLLLTCPMVMVRRTKPRSQGTELACRERREEHWSVTFGQRCLRGPGHWEDSPGYGELGSVWKSGFEVGERENEKLRVGAFRAQRTVAGKTGTGKLGFVNQGRLLRD